LLTRLFLNADRRLRSGWWIALFFVVLAGLLLPLILSAHDTNAGVPFYQQAGIVIIASLLCQFLRRKPVSEMFGVADLRWPRDLLVGGALGAVLMLVPAVLLHVSGYVTFQVNALALSALWPVIGVLAAAAVAEEVLFRGFLFQRFIDGLGVWPAQLVIAALFTLTHSDALEGDRHARLACRCEYFPCFDHVRPRVRAHAQPGAAARAAFCGECRAGAFARVWRQR
jgi:membrane protease YdiL (CAAX protease family)